MMEGPELAPHRQMQEFSTTMRKLVSLAERMVSSSKTKRRSIM
jgi:hypothetical protein